MFITDPLLQRVDVGAPGRHGRGEDGAHRREPDPIVLGRTTRAARR